MSNEGIKERLNEMLFALETWLECSIELGCEDVPNLKKAIIRIQEAQTEIEKEQPNFELINEIVHSNELLLFNMNPIQMNYN